MSNSKFHLYSSTRALSTSSSAAHLIEQKERIEHAMVEGDDGYFENPIDISEAEMIAHVVDGMAGFLYRKHKIHGNPELASRIYHSDYAAFNDYLDGQREGYRIVDICCENFFGPDIAPDCSIQASTREAV